MPTLHSSLNKKTYKNLQTTQKMVQVFPRSEIKSLHQGGSNIGFQQNMYEVAKDSRKLKTKQKRSAKQT